MVQSLIQVQFRLLFSSPCPSLSVANACPSGLSFVRMLSTSDVEPVGSARMAKYPLARLLSTLPSDFHFPALMSVPTTKMPDLDTVTAGPAGTGGAGGSAVTVTGTDMVSVTFTVTGTDLVSVTMTFMVLVTTDVTGACASAAACAALALLVIVIPKTMPTTANRAPRIARLADQRDFFGSVMLIRFFLLPFGCKVFRCWPVRSHSVEQDRQYEPGAIRTLDEAHRHLGVAL